MSILKPKPPTAAERNAEGRRGMSRPQMTDRQSYGKAEGKREQELLSCLGPVINLSLSGHLTLRGSQDPQSRLEEKPKPGRQRPGRF